MAKQKFKITNWPTYNKALRQRGSLTAVAVNEVDTLIRFYAAVFNPVSGLSGFSITTPTRCH
ncbi:hypothetical protein DN614_21390 [Klebsiella michiganensis]|nr:hypothetical protein F7Q97_16900 [Klebsiella michiganensis]PPA48992.1 hypothetical protein CDA56_10245 [Klebsiella michiganensis]RWS82453.1 hypothetical protein DN614_21390 [Klebsiella michiganensis]